MPGQPVTGWGTVCLSDAAVTASVRKDDFRSRYQRFSLILIQNTTQSYRYFCKTRKNTVSTNSGRLAPKRAFSHTIHIRIYRVFKNLVIFVSSIDNRALLGKLASPTIFPVIFTVKNQGSYLPRPNTGIGTSTCTGTHTEPESGASARLY